MDQEYALGNVKIVQRPLVRLALFVGEVGLEALPRREGHDVDLRERIVCSQSSFELTAMTLKEWQNC